MMARLMTASRLVTQARLVHAQPVYHERRLTEGGEEPPLMLDLSRLLARAQRGAPTGIDRVEHAYAEQLLLQAPERLRFVAIDKLDRLRSLPMAATRDFIAAIGAHWSGTGGTAAEIGAAARMIWVKAMLRPGPAPLGRGDADPLYLLLSHRHLHRRNRLERAITAVRARLITFVHDLIPIEFPEYARPMHAEIHLQRIQSAVALSDGIIVNSQATADSLEPYLAAAHRRTPVLVAPLGVRALPGAMPPPPAKPYFVCLGTIEPRKNHMLLLHIWRRLAQEMGDAAPRLVIIGRRGWEHENVEDMLERSPAIRALVTERTGLSDVEVGTLLRGCRALLFPSFAEGYGLPLAEALASGVPAICSDLPSLREVGGGVPDYLDPLDGVGWLEAVAAYAPEGSARRAAQQRRMGGWQGIDWQEHVRTAIEFSRTLVTSSKEAVR